MFPGMNPKKMQQMMKQMGIQQVDVPATEVIIKQDGKELVITSPQVVRVNMMGQQTYQITGEMHERKLEVEISNQDVDLIVEQTGCSQDDARAALLETNDLAAALMKINESKD